MFILQELFPKGLLLVRPTRHLDRRGYFAEIFNRRSFADLGIAVDFVQDNEAFSTDAGTMRGLHYQYAPDPQSKLVRVVAGAVFDAVVDLRNGSPTFGKWCGTTLTPANHEMLFIPAGFAHGYCTLEPNTVVAYKTDGYYNKSVEGGVRWNDPEIGIDWPFPFDRMIVSEKDANLPFLSDVPKPLRFHG